MFNVLQEAHQDSDIHVRPGDWTFRRLAMKIAGPGATVPDIVSAWQKLMSKDSGSHPDRTLGNGAKLRMKKMVDPKHLDPKAAAVVEHALEYCSDNVDLISHRMLDDTQFYLGSMILSGKILDATVTKLTPAGPI